MLILHEMRWSHVFSYGANNKINFRKQDLLQLVGKNGHGKSSIPLILEEVVFNKNSKGIKKAKVINRYSKATKYTIELDFEKDGDNYTISTTRGATQSVTLTKNGENISEHTSTATYKLIEEIWGFDHKAFTQIVYQSNPFSLEFLTATDTNRKKFLIDLLRLTKYGEALDYYKEEAKEISKETEVTGSKLKLLNSVIGKYANADLTVREFTELPVLDSSLQNELATINLTIANINSTNAKITQNNKYKEILAGIDISAEPVVIEDSTPLKIRQSELQKKLGLLQSAASGVVLSVCPSCKQPVDNSHKLTMVNEAKTEIPGIKLELESITTKLAALAKLTLANNAAVSAKADWEKYYSLVDRSMTSVLLDKNELLTKQSLIADSIKRAKAHYDSIVAANAAVSAHNARVEVISTELAAAREEIVAIQTKHAELNTRLSNVQILVKTFSTTGLVAYKIECLVKDLEQLTNEYLQDMSDGQFQISFKISSSDKLDVVITDNGIDIDINALSNGELARVNVSTLLAIRKLMQTLSKSKVNLLILDETVESLDAEGKEKLVEVLLKQESLNTILVSHGFTHPLIEKMSIVKTNRISRIE